MSPSLICDKLMCYGYIKNISYIKCLLTNKHAEQSRADSGISLKQQSPTDYAKKKTLPTEDNRQAITLFYSQMFPFVLLKGDCATAVLQHPGLSQMITPKVPMSQPEPQDPKPDRELRGIWLCLFCMVK